MRVWHRRNYIVEEVEFALDLHAFNVIYDDTIIATIIPGTIEEMHQIIEQLDNGEEVEGWKNGLGETIIIPDPTLWKEFKAILGGKTIDMNKALFKVTKNYISIVLKDEKTGFFPFSRAEYHTFKTAKEAYEFLVQNNLLTQKCLI